MTDIVEGKPQGLALDMMQSRSIAGFDTRIVGTNRYEETAGSDVVRRSPPACPASRA